MARDDLLRAMHLAEYDHMTAHWPVQFLGVRVEKPANDLFTYAEIIHQLMPDVIIDIGTRWGGSALWFACMMDLMQHGQVISIDIKPHIQKRHSRIKYLEGNAFDPYLYQFVEDEVGDKTCMVSEDSSHTKENTLKVLELYGGLVTPGQYMVVEDININGHPVRPDHGPGPYEAVEEFMEGNDKWERDHSVSRFLYTWMAWLRKK